MFGFAGFGSLVFLAIAVVVVVITVFALMWINLIYVHTRECRDEMRRSNLLLELVAAEVRASKTISPWRAE